ncbi:hypothetical protein ACH35V_35585 [Actinomadura sp. 1N219]|uniref:hypothetical protein n=1 Tax=Actinomadura sp. 1N219 TaxID=3375152 RepID=UPI0037A89DC5
MWRTPSRIALTASITAALALLPAAHASAASPGSPPGCPERSQCGWSGADFTGTATTFSPLEGCTNAPFPVLSAGNTGGGQFVMYVFAERDCEGEVVAQVSRNRFLPSLPAPGLSAFVVW